jgi:hypothetical protein
MAMSRVLHLISADNSIGPILNHDLIAFIEAVWHLVEITSSNQKEATLGHLNALEIMRKVTVKVNRMLH